MHFEYQYRSRRTSGPMLCRDADACVLNSRCRFSSASFAFFARISSRRCCMAVVCFCDSALPAPAACSWQHGLLSLWVSSSRVLYGAQCSMIGFSSLRFVVRGSSIWPFRSPGYLGWRSKCKMLDGNASSTRFVLSDMSVVAAAVVR